jgi:hypothetical protein
MWQLRTADRGEPWTDIGKFESVTAAARKIIDLEQYPVAAVVFQLDVLKDSSSGSNISCSLPPTAAS